MVLLKGISVHILDKFFSRFGNRKRVRSEEPAPQVEVLEVTRIPKLEMRFLVDVRAGGTSEVQLLRGSKCVILATSGFMVTHVPWGFFITGKIRIQIPTVDQLRRALGPLSSDEVRDVVTTFMERFSSMHRCICEVQMS